MGEGGRRVDRQGKEILLARNRKQKKKKKIVLNSDERKRLNNLPTHRKRSRESQ